jgi:hypothetical protein
MAVRSKRGRFARERRLIVLAASLKSLEAVAKALGRTPQSVAKPEIPGRAKGEVEMIGRF